MNVVAIYPAFDYLINELAMVWKDLCADGSIKGLIIAGSQDTLKNSHSASRFQQTDNLEIHRFTPPLKSHISEILSLVEKVKPELIMCGVMYNLPLALMIQKKFNAPIMLHTEYFLNKTKFINRRYYLGIKTLLPLSYYFFSNWCINNTATILSSDPCDFKDQSKIPPTLHYLPWPHPAEKNVNPFPDRNINSAVYIGSLVKWKGSENLLKYYSYLLTKQPDFKLTLIGPALDTVSKKVVSTLRNFGPDRVDIREKCTRPEALELIGKALFVFSPLDSMGWGLIGDAWNAGTPVLSIGEHYDLIDGKNCIIVKSPDDFVTATKKLQQDQSLWNNLSNEGLNTVKSHSLESVASILRHEILNYAK